MSDRLFRRSGPHWVWLFGLIVLAVAVFFLAEWTGRRGEAAIHGDIPAAAEGRRADTPTPQAVGRAAEIDAAARTSSPVPLIAVLPFSPANDGAMVAFAGEIAGAEVLDGVWLRTTAGVTLFVWIVDAGGQRLIAGSQIDGIGLLRRDPDLVTRWMTLAAMPEAERVRVEQRYYLQTTGNRLRIR